jgi:hypothetical protein
LNTPQKSSTLSNVATFFRFELQSLAPSLFTAVARRGACSSVQGPGLQHVVLSPASKTDRVPRFRAVAAHADGHKCSARMDGAGILTIIEPQNPLVLQRVRHSIVHSRGCPPLRVAVCCGHFSRQNPNGEKPLPVLNPLRKYPAPRIRRPRALPCPSFARPLLPRPRHRSSDLLEMACRKRMPRQSCFSDTERAHIVFRPCRLHRTWGGWRQRQKTAIFARRSGGAVNTRVLCIGRGAGLGFLPAFSWRQPWRGKRPGRARQSRPLGQVQQEERHQRRQRSPRSGGRVRHNLRPGSTGSWRRRVSTSTQRSLMTVSWIRHYARTQFSLGPSALSSSDPFLPYPHAICHQLHKELGRAPKTQHAGQGCKTEGSPSPCRTHTLDMHPPCSTTVPRSTHAVLEFPRLVISRPCLGTAQFLACGVLIAFCRCCARISCYLLYGD